MLTTLYFSYGREERKYGKEKTWTKDEANKLKEIYDSTTVDELIEIFGVTKDCLYSKANSLGIKRRKTWSSEEIDILKNNFNDMSYSEISENLLNCNHSVSAIYTKCNTLGLVKSKKWTKSEIKILEDYYGLGNRGKLLALLPNRTWNTIKDKANKLELRYDEWTNNEDKIIIDSINKSDLEISDMLANRTHRAVKWRREKLGLHKETNGYGNISKSKNGELCHSDSEKYIIDYIYDLGLTYRKDVPYNELLIDDDTLRTCDICIYLNEKIYAIEYFGLYRKTPRNIVETNYIKKMNDKMNDFKENKKEDVVFISLLPKHLPNKFKIIINDLIMNRRINYENSRKN